MSCQDNQYANYGLPAMMNDGRIYSSHVSEQTREDSFRNAYGLSGCHYDNNDVRIFRQKNACKIMKSERAYLFRNYYGWLPRQPIVIEPPYHVSKQKYTPPPPPNQKWIQYENPKYYEKKPNAKYSQPKGISYVPLPRNPKPKGYYYPSKNGPWRKAPVS